MGTKSKFLYFTKEVPQLPPYKPEVKFEDFDDDQEEDDDKINEEPEKNFFQDDEEEKENEYNGKKQRKNKQSTPKIIDPYASDETSYLLPILVTIGAFVPLLYCLCRL
jgi:hypothetical protein